MSGPGGRKATTKQLWVALGVMLAALVTVVAVAVYWVGIRPQSDRADAADAQAQVVASQAQTFQSALATAASACADADTDPALCRTLSSLATQSIAVTPTTTHGAVETVLVPVTEVSVRTQVSVVTVRSGFPVYLTRTFTVPVTSTATVLRPGPTRTFTVLVPSTRTVTVVETPLECTAGCPPLVLLTVTETVRTSSTTTATETVTVTQTAPPVTETSTATETQTERTTATATVTPPPVTTTETTTATATTTAPTTETVTTTETVDKPVTVTVTTTITEPPPLTTGTGG